MNQLPYIETLIMIFVVGIGLYYMKYYIDKMLKANYGSSFINFETFEKYFKEMEAKIENIRNDINCLKVDFESFKNLYEERCNFYDFRLEKLEQKINSNSKQK